MQGWSESDTAIERVVWEQTDACLAVYREDPSRVEQDANNELRISEGGYGDRQLFELVQNAIDAARSGGGRLAVHLTPTALYVANDGEPFTSDGVRALMASDLSRKDDDRIGRFGIGFKSVLAVTSKPKVLSRSVSFAFDAQWAAETIKAEGFASPNYPVMRLAKTLSPTVEAAGDRVLADLMEWASTVVVLPISRRLDLLSRQLISFPPEFALFSTHITEATLTDDNMRDGQGRPATLTIRQDVGPDGLVTLRSGTSETTWVVSSRKYRPSTAGQEEAGRIARRDEIDVQWAVSSSSREGKPLLLTDGAFWAYFPTRARTTLSGLLNAPWKLSDDRLDLLPGVFNEEVLRSEVPGLVAAGLARLHKVTMESGGSPAIVLDVLPARGRETRGWADSVIGGDGLSNPVFARLRHSPSVPDGDGALRSPSDLSRAPAPTSPDWIKLWSEWLERWAAVPQAPVAAWVHPDAYANQERRLKLDRLSGRQSTAAEWLEALVADGSAEASAEAIHLAARMLDDLGASRDAGGAKELRVEIIKARVIRLEDGSFARPVSGKLFVRASPDDNGPAFVDEELARMDGVTKDLATLGVHVMDTAGALRALLAEPVKTDNHWMRIWTATRSVSLAVSAGLFREYLATPLEKSVRVRMASGVMRTIAESFLAGEIIPSHAGRDRDRLIDPVAHADDEPLLRELGAVDRLVWRHDAPVEQWLSGFESRRRVQFVEHIKKTTGTTCALEKIEVKGTPPPWPLEPIGGMSPEARLEATRQVLARPLPAKWTIEHGTARNYPKLRTIAPELAYLRREGLLATSFGPLPPSRTLLIGAHAAADPNVLPVFETSEPVAEALGILRSIGDVSAERWGDWKKVADRWEDDIRRSEFYAWLPGRFRPKTLVVRVGSRREPVEIQNIGVTSDKGVYASMLEAGIPALWVASQSDVDEQFIAHWEMTDGKELLHEEVVSEPSGEATYLLDAFKPLQNFLQVEDHELQLQYCSRLVKMIATPQGQVAQRLSALRDGDRVLVTATDAPRVLLQVSEVLGIGLTAVDVYQIERQMAQTAANELRRRVKRAKDDDARLVEAVGAEALRRSVPRKALEFLENTGGAAGPEDVARLARAVHGVGILKQLKQALEDNGLEPPREWSGRRVSRDFVTSLGFPVEWAGFPTSNRPSMEIVDGPAVLKPLHDFQEFVTEQIVKLLVGIGKDRGMVSLPTGAGKTRVTVEALVNAQREGRLKDAPLVWIAQSDELCEQAAESWTYVWRAIGSSTPMTLSRLWGSNEAAEEPSGFQVVVATIDKLQSISSRPGTDYEWLRDPSVVVVDEAHLSVATSYTQVLEWLGRGRSRKDFRPLIGLTATPFRGTSTAETERLVNRYDGNRLDRGAFRDPDDPYRELQDMHVLAQVRQNLLDGVDVHLSPDEVAEIATMRRLPGAVTERLGLDQARTLRIVESIESLPPDWTVLLFATSVENSRVLAALLSHRGIAAVSISSETEAAARRHYVEQFKAGKIRVLTNFNVLTQGFDAPAVRAVYVTRPTFSPNVYQQMVGRGLRGPRNGGSDEVLIVNMRDNFNQFGDLLAYRDFEYLWTT